MKRAQMRGAMLLLTSVLSFLAICTSQDIEADIDALVEEVLRCSGIPGLTLAVVRDGQVSTMTSLAIFLLTSIIILNVIDGQMNNDVIQLACLGLKWSYSMSFRGRCRKGPQIF